MLEDPRSSRTIAECKGAICRAAMLLGQGTLSTSDGEDAAQTSGNGAPIDK